MQNESILEGLFNRREIPVDKNIKTVLVDIRFKFSNRKWQKTDK